MTLPSRLGMSFAGSNAAVPLPNVIMIERNSCLNMVIPSNGSKIQCDTKRQVVIMKSRMDEVDGAGAFPL